MRPFRDQIGIDDDRMGRLAALETRFDGPIPAPMRDLALAGDAQTLAAQRAHAQLQVITDLTRRSIRRLRVLNRMTDLDPAYRADRERRLLRDLAWYRIERKRLLRRWITLKTPHPVPRQLAAE